MKKKEEKYIYIFFLGTKNMMLFYKLFDFLGIIGSVQAPPSAPPPSPKPVPGPPPAPAKSASIITTKTLW